MASTRNPHATYLGLPRLVDGQRMLCLVYHVLQLVGSHEGRHDVGGALIVVCACAFARHARTRALLPFVLGQLCVFCGVGDTGFGWSVLQFYYAIDEASGVW